MYVKATEISFLHKVSGQTLRESEKLLSLEKTWSWDTYTTYLWDIHTNGQIH